MYVCLCRGVTDGQIRKAASTGEISHMRDLRHCLGVASQCGKCATCANRILKEALAECPKQGAAEVAC